MTARRVGSCEWQVFHNLQVRGGSLAPFGQLLTELHFTASLRFSPSKARRCFYCWRCTSLLHTTAEPRQLALAAIQIRRDSLCHRSRGWSGGASSSRSTRPRIGAMDVTSTRWIGGWCVRALNRWSVVVSSASSPWTWRDRCWLVAWRVSLHERRSTKAQSAACAARPSAQVTVRRRRCPRTCPRACPHLCRDDRFARYHTPRRSAKHGPPTSDRGCFVPWTQSGYWEAPAEGIKSMDECIARCRGCANCRYVSFSLAPAHQDCSWYAKCDMSRLAKPPPSGRDYQSFQVRFE